MRTLTNVTGFICLFFLLPIQMKAQSISINTDGSTADVSAMVDIKSISKGLLIPRLTALQKNTLVTPATGLLIYQTDGAPGFYTYKNFQWSKVITQDSLGYGNVAINDNGANANPSAILDIQSSAPFYRGLLIPRFTAVQKNAISSPATSLLIYQTDGASGFYTYKNFQWSKLITQDSLGYGNVAINDNGATANNSAILDIQSSAPLYRGLLIPRLTVAQKNTITLPATGLLIYQTDGPIGFYHYKNFQWSKLISQDSVGLGNVAINDNGATASNSAILDIQSSAPFYRGVLMPRLTAAQKIAIASPATGLLIFQTDGTAGFYHYTGTGWVRMVEEDAAGNVGIGCTAPAYKLHVIGDIASSATVRGLNVFAVGAITACSDLRYKKDIAPIKNSLSRVMNMQAVTYNWKINEFPGKHFPDALQIGFIAQDMEKIIPQLVTTDSDGYKGIDYGRLTPVLTEAIKEQQKMIESLQTKNNDLQNEVEKMKSDIKLLMSSLNNKPVTTIAK